MAEPQPPPPTVPAHVQPPPRWPPRLALVLGGVCLGGAVAATVVLSGARDRVAAADAAMQAAATAEPAVQRAAVQAVREARAVAQAWARRRLGLGLAGVILLVGGWAALGVRSLYDRMHWAEVTQRTDRGLDAPDTPPDDPASPKA